MLSLSLDVGEGPDPGMEGIGIVRIPAMVHLLVSGLGLISVHPLGEEVVDPGNYRPVRAKILDEAQGITPGGFHAFPELIHLLDVRAAEAIYRLLGVTDHEQLALFRSYVEPGIGAWSGGLTVGNGLGEEHGDLSLKRVGVLNLVDEEVGVAFPEVVTNFQVVAEEVSGPDEKVLELGAALGAAFFGIVNYELPQGFENGHQGGSVGYL